MSFQSCPHRHHARVRMNPDGWVRADGNSTFARFQKRPGRYETQAEANDDNRDQFISYYCWFTRGAW
jgi:hypothetical protein